MLEGRGDTPIHSDVITYATSQVHLDEEIDDTKEASSSDSIKSYPDSLEFLAAATLLCNRAFQGAYITINLDMITQRPLSVKNSTNQHDQGSKVCQETDDIAAID